MNLDTTLKVLQIVLGEAATTNDCNVTTSWADTNTTTLPPIFVLGNTNTDSDGTTPVDVVGAPAFASQRQVKEVRLFNNDTVTHTVTLQLFDGTDTWIIGPSNVEIAVGGSFVYTPEAQPQPLVTHSGSFVANGVTPVTVTDANVTGNSAIVITLKTVGGTVGAVPAIKTITPGTGFTVAATALDLSTYNYLIIG